MNSVCLPRLLSSLWVSRTGSASDWCALQEVLYKYIHSFIADIYIAPLQVGYSEALPAPAQPNNVVLSCWRNFWENTLGSTDAIQYNTTTIITFWPLFVLAEVFQVETWSSNRPRPSVPCPFLHTGTCFLSRVLNASDVWCLFTDIERLIGLQWVTLRSCSKTILSMNIHRCKKTLTPRTKNVKNAFFMKK